MKLQAKVSCLVLCVLTATMVVMGGCTVAKISGRGAIPLLLNQPAAKVEVIEPIRVSKIIAFDYTASYDVSEILSEVFAETKADAIINIVFTVKTTPADFLVNMLTLGIANAKTVEISGQAVRAPQGLGSLFGPGSETLAESKDLESLVPTLLQESGPDDSSNMIVRVQHEENEAAYKLIRYKLDILDH